MRLFASLCVFPFAALILWLGGYDFDTRNFGVAYAFTLTCICSVIVYLFPGWQE